MLLYISHVVFALAFMWKCNISSQTIGWGIKVDQNLLFSGSTFPLFIFLTGKKTKHIWIFLNKLQKLVSGFACLLGTILQQKTRILMSLRVSKLKFHFVVWDSNWKRFFLQITLSLYNYVVLHNILGFNFSVHSGLLTCKSKNKSDLQNQSINQSNETYSVRRPVWSWLGSDTRANPKSQIWVEDNVNFTLVSDWLWTAQNIRNISNIAIIFLDIVTIFQI